MGTPSNSDTRVGKDIRRALNEFITRGKELLSLLRSSQGDLLCKAELHHLRTYLHLLDLEATYWHDITITGTTGGPSPKADPKTIVNDTQTTS